MSLGHGAKIVTDGLVFAYDMGNTKKSWRGAPYKNELLSDTGWWGDGSNQSGFSKGGTSVTNTKLMYDGLPTVLWSPGTSRNCYLNGSGDLNYSSVSTEWTFSCYVKREDGLPITSMNVYMYYPSSDGASSGTIKDMGNGWYQISRIRTGSSNYLGLVGFTGMASNVKYYLSGPMLTKTQFPVHSVPAQVTRTSTEAIIDQVGGNTITASSLTYNSDNTFSFTGTDGGSSDRLTIADPGYPTNWTQPYTIETVFKVPTGTTWYHAGSGTAILGRGSYTGSHGFLKNGEGSVRFWQRTDVSSYTVTKSGLANDVWHHLIGVSNGASGFDFYHNGELVGTNSSFSYTSSAMDTGSWSVGGGIAFGGSSGLYGGGDIPLVRMYSKALTADEVKQNFAALRGRYGI